MAYLIVSTLKGREVAREPLLGSAVIGRSPECDVRIHDILLSRRHCQIERHGSQWMLVDLASRNGSFINGKVVRRCHLKDSQEVLIGKTRITFCTGTLATRSAGGRALDKPNRPRPRPADPWAAMEDTVSGFDYAKMVAERKNSVIGHKPNKAQSNSDRVSFPPMARPQPVPRDPESYENEDIYTLISDLCSSSWDSIYMQAARRMDAEAVPRPVLKVPRQTAPKPIQMLDLSLDLPPDFKPVEFIPQAPPPAIKRRVWRHVMLKVARGLATVGQAVLLLGLVRAVC